MLNLPKQSVHQRPAALWKRLGSFAIDLFFAELILLAPFKGVIAAAFPEIGIGKMQELIAHTPGLMTGTIFLLFTMGLILLGYLSLMQYLFHATIGMMIMDIELQNADDSYWRCVVRNIFIIPLMPFVLLWAIDPIHYLFTKRRLTEQLSRTWLSEQQIYVQ